MFISYPVTFEIEILIQVRRKYDDDIRKSLDYVLAKGQIGDWFVLYQLSKNCNPYFFREFIRELAMELSNRPKTSKYRSASIGTYSTQQRFYISKDHVQEAAHLGGTIRSIERP